jgi:aryl-alcohol dehydrogenase-like predicted oxidoreductase
MRYKLLGRSGLRVSELCLGAMTFGEQWGWGASRKETGRIFDAFVERGGNFIDTANKYTEGTSEEYCGELIAPDRGRYVLATKFTLSMTADDPNASGNHRKNMVQSLEASLRRLKSDYIDLYWLHAWDFTTPVDEVMRALDDMVRAGKILYIGISDTPAWRVSQMNTLAELRGWTSFVGLQVPYSLIEREVERELLPMAREFDMAVTAWGAVGGGVLTGKYLSEEGKAEAARKEFNEHRLTEKNLGIARKVVDLAATIKRTPSQVALNWVRQQSRAQIVPILGARTLKQMEDNLGCLDFELTDEQMTMLDEASAIEMGFPHDFLTGPVVRTFIYGETFDRIDNHRG